MKFVNPSVFLSILFISFSSCSKDEKSEDKSVFRNSSDLIELLELPVVPHVNDILIKAMSVDNRVESIEMTSEFRSFSDGSAVLADRLMLGKHEFKDSVNSGNRQSAHLFRHGNAFLGVNLVTYVEVSGVLDAGAFYTPEPIYFSVHQDMDSLDVTRPIYLMWKEDPKNEIGKVGIEIFDLGIDGNPSSDGGNRAYVFTVPDTGAFEIEANWLDALPDGCHFDIVLTRGAHLLLEDSQTLATAIVSSKQSGVIRK